MLPARSMARDLSLLGLTVSMIFLSTSPATARVLELVEQEVDVRLQNLDELFISPDGAFVYVQGARFRRDASSGELTFEGTDFGAEMPTISSDGRSLYGVSSLVLRTFSRDVESGALRVTEELPSSPAFGVHGSPSRVWLSPDGAHAYVQVHEANSSFEGLRGLAVFERDSESGFLSWIETIYDGVEGELTAADLIFSADGRYVYGIAKQSHQADRLVVFSRDPVSGKPAWKQVLDGETIPQAADIRELWLSRDGLNLYASGSQGMVTLRRNPTDGTLAYAETVGSARTWAVGPDDRFVYAFLWSTVDIYSRQEGTGTLEFVETQELGLGLEYPNIRSARFSPDGRHVYLPVGMDFLSDGVVVLARDSSSGRLSWVTSYFGDVEGDADGVHEPRALVASADGRHVYLGGGGLENEVAIFSRSEETGSLDYLSSASSSDGGVNGPRNARHLTLSPDDRSLYVHSQIPGDDRLVVFGRDELSGELTRVETHFRDSVLGLRDLQDLAVSPDGRHLYVGGDISGPIITFERDPDTGGLTYLRSHRFIPGLTAAHAIRFSADGRFVYIATGGRDPQLLVLGRNDGSGHLGLVEAFNIPGESSVSSVEVGPDGRFLYAAGTGLSVLGRSHETGRLTFLDRQPTRTDHLQITPDGRYVFGFRDDITVYRRNPSTGLLKALETESSGDIPHGSFPSAVLSPAGDYVYAGFETTVTRDVVRVYRVEEGPCRSTWDGLCLAEDRFRVELEWRDGEGNSGTAEPVLEDLGDSGLLWFFDPDNWEMQLKVLDGCELNHRFWVFAASATQVEFTLRITDVLTGAERTYFNPLGHAAVAVTDTEAFACSGSAAADPTFVDLSTWSPAAGSPPISEAYGGAPDPTLGKSHRPGFVQGLGGKCLDVEGGSPVDGAPVVLYDCHGGANQQWLKVHDCSYHCLAWFSLMVFGDKCLVPGQEPLDGHRRLEIGPCGPEESLWLADQHFPQEFPLEHVETGLCADVLDGDMGNRAPVVLDECHGRENQQWAFDELACVASATGACKNQERFLVEVEWRDFTGNSGRGRAQPQGSDETALFWFFNPENSEVMVKVLDGCDVNQRHWVFAAATTNLEYTLRVTDTRTREVREYFNPLGNSAPAITDSSAFPCSAP